MLDRRCPTSVAVQRERRRLGNDPPCTRHDSALRKFPPWFPRLSEPPARMQRLLGLSPRSPAAYCPGHTGFSIPVLDLPIAVVAARQQHIPPRPAGIPSEIVLPPRAQT